MKADVVGLLKTLSDERPIFHSEADFQHALAWKLHSTIPTASIRMEINSPAINRSPQQKAKSKGRMRLDIRAQIDKLYVGLELKYRTNELSTTMDGELFKLSKHSAYPIGRRAFLDDLRRLEYFVDHEWIDIGYAILLTNAYTYWNPSQGEYNCDKAYEIFHERSITPGSFDWAAHTGSGTKGKATTPITLRSAYRFQWHHYSTIPSTMNCQFKFLVVEVNSRNDSTNG